ncbi:hypothetical protein [Burkholderia ubonensis]|uniref:hypothetical protein n=1 Tax=Burkholderia ubonensis TaxID=101571 RepID=UPI00075F4791|nr:hypothetical protein [Burkholderia ubonensis]KVQ92660.1 hypothetical protein WK10_26565 [Burkholderia ubonensis]KVZ33906.1 hypothetical protein WL17_26845 [Burkholderia ubonensis]KWK76800.1 hypothetical protein WM17_27625 [Burkholderia ubonensis]KWK91323.1 hypothetical protein WM18_20790 [Burkholderia ubonensis]
MKEPQHELKNFYGKYENLNVHQSTRWYAAVAGYLVRLTRSKLAIVAMVTVDAIAAFKGLSGPIALASIGAILLLGIVGGIRES